MAELKTKLSDPLLLSLQLFDGSASLPKRVYVELSNPAGVLLESRFEIPHVINGDFRDETRLMTTDAYLVAQYFVYENDGVTADEDYIINKDVFIRDITGELVEDLDAGTSTIEVTGTLTGEITDTNLSGEINDENILDGLVNEEYTITGEIKDE